MTSYVGHGDVTYRAGGLKRIIVSIMVALMTMALVVPVAFANNSNALAFINDLMCGSDLGLETSYRSSKDSLTDGTDTIMDSGGKYSAMDVYSGSLVWTTWNGKNVADDKKGVFDFGQLKNATDDDKKEAVQKMADEQHDGIGCVTKSLMSMLANIILFISSLVVKFTSMFVTWAVNPNLICQDPKNPTGFCVNLIGIIGGDGSDDGGIIGNLYHGLYLGLASVVFVTVAVWMLWKGIVKGQTRNAWFGLGWAILSFILGVIVLSNPMLVAAAPMNASVMLGSCVIESLNGRSCLSTENTSEVQEADTTANPATLCLIDPNKSINMSDHLAIDARMSTCKIWKAFMLEPWAQGQFGMSYEALEGQQVGTYNQSELVTSVKDKDEVGKIWENAGVSLTAASTGELCKGSPVYHNIALYQLDLMTDVHDGMGSGCGDYHSSSKIKTNANVYNDWYYIIYTMTQAGSDTGEGSDNVSHSYLMWNGSAGFTRASLALVSIIASFCFFMIIVGFSFENPGAAVQAIGYLFMGTILTVFAPIFMLVGIHPTTGKKIFLGWLELEIGTILKYFFIIMWISMVVEIYGAILGSTSNAGLILVFVIAMTVTLKTYQPELIEIFGNVDLGGKKLSNALGEKWKKAMRTADDLKSAAGAGALAGFMAGGGSLGDRLRSASDMSKYQFMQEGKRKGGFVGNAFQSADRIYDKRRNDAIKKAERLKEETERQDADARAAEQAAFNDFNDVAQQGLVDENGQILDYDNLNGVDIDNIAAQQVQAARDEDAAGSMAMDTINNAERQQAMEDDQKFADWYANGGADKVKFDAATGTYSAKDKNDHMAMEYAFRANQQALNELQSQGIRKLSEDGTHYEWQFANEGDKKKYNALNAAINDKNAVDNHAEYQQYNNRDDYVRDQFEQALASGKFDGTDIAKIAAEGKDENGNTGRDRAFALAKQRAQGLQSKIDGIEAKRVSSRSALGLKAAYNEAHANAEQLHTKADQIRNIADSVTSRSSGAMWSHSEIERLNGLKQGLESKGLSGVAVPTSITDGAARMDTLKNVGNAGVGVASRAVEVGGQVASRAASAAADGAATVMGNHQANLDIHEAQEQLDNANWSAASAEANGDMDAAAAYRAAAQQAQMDLTQAQQYRDAGGYRTDARQAIHDTKESVKQTAQSVADAPRRVADAAQFTAKAAADVVINKTNDVMDSFGSTRVGEAALDGAAAASAAAHGVAEAAHYIATGNERRYERNMDTTAQAFGGTRPTGSSRQKPSASRKPESSQRPVTQTTSSAQNNPFETHSHQEPARTQEQRHAANESKQESRRSRRERPKPHVRTFAERDAEKAAARQQEMADQVAHMEALKQHQRDQISGANEANAIADYIVNPSGAGMQGQAAADYAKDVYAVQTALRNGEGLDSPVVQAAMERSGINRDELQSKIDNFGKGTISREDAKSGRHARRLSSDYFRNSRKDRK